MRKLGYFFIIFFCSFVYAQEPTSYVDNKVSKALMELRKFPEVTNKQAYHIISNYIMPEVDLTEVSKWIAGRTVWKRSTKLQRQQFMDAIASYMSTTYGDIMLEFIRAYRVIKFEYQPMRDSYQDKKRVLVSSKLIMEDPISNAIARRTVNFDFRLIKNQNTWKFYDMAAEGVSILKGLQELISDDVRSQGIPKGIELLNNMVLIKRKPNFLGLLKLLDKESE